LCVCVCVCVCMCYLTHSFLMHVIVIAASFVVFTCMPLQNACVYTHVVGTSREKSNTKVIFIKSSKIQHMVAFELTHTNNFLL
jgi:hypothetical protein